MLYVDTRINNVGTSAFTGALIVDISSSTRLGARQSSQSPICIALGGLDGHNGILFDVLDLETRQGVKIQIGGA